MEFLWSVQLHSDQEVREAYGVKNASNPRSNNVDRLPSSDPGPMTEKEMAFGGNVGFPTERRPAEYWQEIPRWQTRKQEEHGDMGGEVNRTLRELGLDQLIGNYEMTVG